LRKFKSKLALLLVLTMLATMVISVPAFAADPVKVTFTTAEGISESSDDATNLGFVKISEVESCDSIYVEMNLPDKVDFKTAPTEAAIEAALNNAYIEGTATTFSPEWVSGDADEYVIKFNITEGQLKDADYIKLLFNNVLVKAGAPDEIVAAITVKGVEDEHQVWSYSKDCTIGTQGDGEVTVTTATAKGITVGSKQKLADITFKENLPGALRVNDQFILTLPSGIEWDSDAPDAVMDGSYNLAVNAAIGDPDELIITVTHVSSIFGDKIKIDDAYVTVFPDAEEGDVEVEVEAVLDEADFDDTSIVPAYVGDTAAAVSAEDTSDVDIYQAVYNKEVDMVKLEAAGQFAEGDKFTMTLSEGAYWYLEKSDFTGTSAIGEGKVECLGFYDDNQSAWFEVTVDGDTETEIELEGLLIATTPEAPLGDITVTVDGDFEGEAVVGEIIASATVTADAPKVDLAALNVVAGDIKIVETKKKSLQPDQDGTYDDEGYDLILDLPNGVEWSAKPKVKVNGDKVTPKIALSDDNDKCYIEFSNELRTAKVDEILIYEVKYDLDTRVRSTEVAVALKGEMVNKLNGVDDDIIDDFSDYADDKVFSVVNAKALSPETLNATFTIGSMTYTVNGVAMTADYAPFISGDRTFLPVRFVAYALGVTEANIIWDQANQTVTLMKGDKVVQLKVGSTTLLVNGAPITMDVAPINTGERVCLPIRFVAQAFGADVAWDAATQVVTITR
jgi:hypothetical protein